VPVGAGRQQGQAAAAAGDGAGGVSGDLDHGRMVARRPASGPLPMLQGGEDGQAGMPAGHAAWPRFSLARTRYEEGSHRRISEHGLPVRHDYLRKIFRRADVREEWIDVASGSRVGRRDVGELATTDIPDDRMRQ
jgi:hypothetical protein